MFINRQHAGIRLATQIVALIDRNSQFELQKIIVLGLPRGGVPVALEIALELKCPLNVITSKKIGAPEQPELAIGAVTSNGVVIIDTRLKEYLGVTQAYLDKEKEYLASRTKRMETTLRQAASLSQDLDLKNK